MIIKDLRIGILSFILILFFCSVSPLYAKVKLPSVFCDNMVLQQQSDVAIWGWSTPKTAITITTSWNNKTYNAESGKEGEWRIKVNTPEASFKSHSITISDGENVVLNNILIGEVWLCSGQSNMEMPMKGFRNQPIEFSTEAIMNSKNKNIRMFTVKRQASLVPLDTCEGLWQEANPETIAGFSATAYFFGRMLNKNLNIPIGLIHASWGGSRIEAWMNAESLESIPEKVVPEELLKGRHRHTPTALFNGMVHPILGYGIKGAIWYQGESNRQEPDLYVRMFDAMVTSWRDLWEMKDFPFYYAQIAPFDYQGQHGTGPNSAFIREAQAKGMKTTENTGMAVLMDSKSVDCIHPPQKKQAGERLAFWALAQTYGLDEIPYKSPELLSVDIDGKFVTLTFDVSHDPGLTCSSKEVNNFKIAGENKRFYAAKAGIYGNQIFLFAPEVKEPKSIRYCFDNTSVSDVFSVYGGLPLSSFRTDTWDMDK